MRFLDRFLMPPIINWYLEWRGRQINARYFRDKEAQKRREAENLASLENTNRFKAMSVFQQRNRRNEMRGNP